MKSYYLHSEGGGISPNSVATSFIRQIGFVFFAGLGGVSQSGAEAKIDGQSCIKVLYALNHDDIAIETHKANHPEVKHAIEDIWRGPIDEMVECLNFWKLIYPNALVFIQDSSECTNYSGAKGGQSRDADSRMLPNSLFRYIEAINPDIIYIENVEEIMCWGPMKIKAKKRHNNYTELKTWFNKKTGQEEYVFEPYSRKNGLFFMQWRDKVKSYGYNYEFRLLDAADYGAYTSRERFFAIFAKPGINIVFPKPTHSKIGSSTDLFSAGLQKWRPVSEVLDLSDHGYSIFYRKGNTNLPSRYRRGICDKTYARYYNALVKHIAGNIQNLEERKQFLTIYHGSGPQSYSLERPSTTIPTKDSLSLITAVFWLDKQYRGEHNHQATNRPSGTVMPVDKHRLMTAEQIIFNPAWGGHSMKSDRPCMTIVARQDKAPVSVINVLHGEHVAIPVYADDSEIVVKIKEFMALYNIVDIKMRMLKVSELKLIMGFPEDYILKGSLEQQKKGIGNAVEVNLHRAIFEASCAANPIYPLERNAA